MHTAPAHAVPLSPPSDFDSPSVAAHTPSARRVLFFALTIGLMGDQLLRVGFTGIGPAMWLLLVILALALLTRRSTLLPIAQRHILISAGILLALMVAVRESEELTVAVVLAVFTLGAIAVSAFRGDLFTNLLELPILHAIFGAGRVVVAALIGVVPLVLRDLPAEAVSSERAVQRSAVIRGLIITVPLVAIFISLFASADPTFEELTNVFHVDIGQLLGHILLTGLFTWYAAGVLRHATRGADNAFTRPANIEAIGAIEIRMLLGAMTFIFTIFVALQLPRMFAGEEYIIRETGLTYAGYARRGFFECVAASGLTLAVIAGLRSVIRQQGDSLRMLRMFGSVLVVLVFIILQSALHRLALYVDAYGWSVDRVFAIAIVAWLTVTFSWLSSTLLGRRPERFVALAVGGGVAALVALFAVNPEGIVVGRNAERARAGLEFDFRYVGYNLGSDAAPALARELPRLPAEIKLTGSDCQHLGRYLNRIDKPTDARAWTISAMRAQRVAASIEAWRTKRCFPASKRAPEPIPSRVGMR